MPTDPLRAIARRTLLAGAGAFAVSTLGPYRAQAARPARIEIDGNRFLYDGKLLRLTGIAVGDPTYVRALRPLSDYQALAADWRVNCVRISVLPALWRADPDAMSAALAANVAAARAQELFVIIDWHRIGFPDLYDPIPPADWGLPPDVMIASLNETAAFWQIMARQYGDDPSIIFEIWNEPSADAYLWTATGQHWPIFKAAWEQIIAAIRPLADNIVLCGGGYWAHDLVGVKDDLIADARTAYAWHAYPNAERGNMEARIQTLGGLQAVKPIVVTEWGFRPGSDDDLRGTVDDFAEPFVTEILDAFGLSHTAWCYSTGAMPNLLADEDGTPSEAGAFVRGVLRTAAATDSWRLTTA
ncbi:MAG: cellulase family glycosylhydrolase [Devosia sp.]